MKKYLIALFIFVSIALISVIYKNYNSRILRNFPIQEFKVKSDNPVLYLFLFFSIDNCAPCLDIIQVLNNLPNNYKVIGLIPERQLEIIKEVREVTNASFELRSLKKFKRFLPNYAPTLIGVNSLGQTFFVIPGVPNESAYLEQFLESFIRKASSLL